MSYSTPGDGRASARACEGEDHLGELALAVSRVARDLVGAGDVVEID